MDTPVLCIGDIEAAQLESLLGRYWLKLRLLSPGTPIPGSWFGDPEAGLIGNQVIVRADTPVHSALHESCHFICMDDERRANLHTDAGGDYDEENAVNYLSILLANHLPRFGRARMLRDMDRWGYTFRLGSARRWFEEDAGETRRWLLRFGLIDGQDQPTWRLRSYGGLSSAEYSSNSA